MCFLICFMLCVLACPDILLSRNFPNIPIPSLQSLRPMNGLKPAEYDKFWEKWSLVSVRFREDNREQRFVYANKIAYEAMSQSVEKYPDGSAFGKITFTTKADDKFPNSLEPIQFSRMQVMVKKKEIYKETDGWGYIIIPIVGTADKDHDRMLACHACHTLVPERDFIFSTPTFLNNSQEKIKKKLSSLNFENQFILYKKQDLRAVEKAMIPLFKYPNRKIHINRMRLFSGSLSESIGPMISYANENKSYLLLDDKTHIFSLVEKLKATKGCEKRYRLLQSRLMRLRFHVEGKPHEAQEKVEMRFQESIMCNGDLRPSTHYQVPEPLRKWLPMYPKVDVK